MDARSYQLLADAVLVLHAGVVLFVVGGLGAIVLGNLRRWRWVNSMRFRVAHLAAIGIVVLQAWLGRICALTSLESFLRERAGQAVYRESFIQHWVQRVIYYEVPLWAFALAYTAFALLVLGAWWGFPPERKQAGVVGPFEGRSVVPDRGGEP